MFHLLPAQSAAAPLVTALEHTISSSLYTLTCTSTGSPPTTVTWTKDGETLITDGTTYSLTQTLVNRVTSTYNSTLTVEASFADILGEYSCSVMNSIGTSNVQQIKIQGRSNWWNVLINCLCPLQHETFGFIPPLFSQYIEALEKLPSFNVEWPNLLSGLRVWWITFA